MAGMKAKFAALAIGLLVVQMTCSAQGGRPGGGQSSSPAPGAAPVDPIVMGNRGWDDAFKKGRTGDRLLGEVTIEGSNLSWDPIVVSVKCNGKTSFATTTDPKGYFIIARPGPVNATTIIGKEKSFVAQFAGCTVSATLPGFNSSQIAIANRDLTSSPNLGTIKLAREDTGAGAALSATTASAPKHALKSFEKARNEWLNNKPDRAQRELQKATEIYPPFAEAWYQLGKIQVATHSPEALHSFIRAAEADPKFVLPYEQMAPLSAQAEKWQELVEVTSRALELNPTGNLDVWHYHALGNYHLKRLDVAEKSALKSLSMDPLHLQPDTEQLLAVILSDKKDTAGALEHLRNCVTYYAPGPDLDLVKRQIARLEAAEPVKVASSEPVSSAPISAVVDIPMAANPSSSCRIDEVLPKVTLNVEGFVENVEKFTATEVLVHERLDRNGSLKDEIQSKSNYVATIQKVEPNSFVVGEYRTETPGKKPFEGTLRANVAPALVLVFHSSHIGEFAMTCDGPTDWSGFDTWRVDFRQRMDRPATMSGFEVGRFEYTVLLKGSAWIDRNNFQIVHMETDLLQSIPEMKLEMLHQSIDYRSVAFSGGEANLWLPQKAEVTADFRGRRLVERHSYSEFQIFSINTKQKISEPPADQIEAGPK